MISVIISRKDVDKRVVNPLKELSSFILHSRTLSGTDFADLTVYHDSTDKRGLEKAMFLYNNILKPLAYIVPDTGEPILLIHENIIISDKIISDLGEQLEGNTFVSVAPRRIGTALDYSSRCVLFSRDNFLKFLSYEGDKASFTEDKIDDFGKKYVYGFTTMEFFMKKLDGESLSYKWIDSRPIEL